MWEVRVLLDMSGSMGGRQDNGKRIFDTVVHSAVDTVIREVWEAARSEQKSFRVHVDTFNHEYTANAVPSYTVTPRYNTEEHMKERCNSLVDTLAASPCQGMTLMYDSVWRAMNALLASKSERSLLVLVTDGADTCSTAHKWSDVQTVVAANSTLKLCPIMCSDIHTEELARVAQGTGLITRPPPLFHRTSSSSVDHSMRCASEVVRGALTGELSGDVLGNADLMSLAVRGAVLGVPYPLPSLRRMGSVRNPPPPIVTDIPIDQSRSDYRPGLGRMGYVRNPPPPIVTDIPIDQSRADYRPGLRRLASPQSPITTDIPTDHDDTDYVAVPLLPQV